jgi:hypothetical protein
MTASVRRATAIGNKCRLELGSGLAQAAGYYERQQHSAHLARYGVDLGVFCGSLLAFPLWFLGYPDRALRKSRSALSLVQSHARDEDMW